jgi:hypothetical protein
MSNHVLPPFLGGFLIPPVLPVVADFVVASLEVENIFDVVWQESYQWDTPGRMIFGRLKILF